MRRSAISRTRYADLSGANRLNTLPTDSQPWATVASRPLGCLREWTAWIERLQRRWLADSRQSGSHPGRFL